MHKRIALISSFIFSVTLLICVNLSAEYVDDNIGVYKSQNTLLKMELRNKDTQEWVTVWDYTSDTANAPNYDAAAEAADNIGLLQDAEIEETTYDKIKVTMISSILVDCWVKSGDTYYWSDSSVEMTQTNSGTYEEALAGHEQVTFSPPEDSGIPEIMTGEQFITGDFTPTRGTKTYLTVKFNRAELFAVQQFEGPEGVTLTCIVPSSSDDDPVVTQFTP